MTLIYALKVQKLRSAEGAGRGQKIDGSGPRSRSVKTAAKCTKGYKARSGGGKAGGFEGGQMPLYRRLPKRGFVPYGGGGTVYAVVNLKSLGGFTANAVVDPDGLLRAGLIKASERSRVKILGGGAVAH